MNDFISQPDAQSSEKPWVAAGFEAVQGEFKKILQDPEELGSALSVYWHGKPIVNLWGGFASPKRQALWHQQSVASLFSVTKSLTALCLLHLIDQGKAELDDKVITYWPEFDKGDVFDWARMIKALEDEKLLSPPGEKLAYHAITFGHLVGEIIRRISGVLPSVYFADKFAQPLGLNLSIRLLPTQKADLTLASGNSWKLQLTRTMLAYTARPSKSWESLYYRPISRHYHPNSRKWQDSEVPATTGFGTAHSLAHLYAMLAEGGCLDGHRIFSENMMALMRQDHCPAKMDQGLQQELKMGLGLYFNHGHDFNMGPNPNNFGHTGMGGVTAFADPDKKIGFGYLCNHLYQPTPESRSMIGDRAIRLAEKLYECLAQQKT